MKPSPNDLARQFGYPLDRPWSQLTDAQKVAVEAAMRCVGGRSANGLVGWFGNQRFHQRYRLREAPISVDDLKRAA